MAGYTEFAAFYDRLMSDCDYHARARYLAEIFERFGKKPTLLLDLCCGTASMSLEFAEAGAEVIGVDASPEMLSVAREKASERGTDMLLLCQQADELDLYGTVNGAICTLDSVNHITDYAVLCRAFERVSLFLEQGCLFVFDANTEYKHKKVLGNKRFVFSQNGIDCEWKNSTKGNLTEIELNFYEKNGADLSMYTERFCERAYSVGELSAALHKAGLQLEAVYGDMSFDPPKSRTERNIFVSRKI